MVIYSIVRSFLTYLNRYNNVSIADSESSVSQSVGNTLADQNNIPQNVSQSVPKQDEEVSYGR